MWLKHLAVDIVTICVILINYLPVVFKRPNYTTCITHFTDHLLTMIHTFYVVINL
jgi:hypothetical protein